MAGKLSISFKKATGCRNQSTWTINCESKSLLLIFIDILGLLFQLNQSVNNTIHTSKQVLWWCRSPYAFLRFSFLLAEGDLVIRVRNNAFNEETCVENLFEFILFSSCAMDMTFQTAGFTTFQTYGQCNVLIFVAVFVF